MDLVTRQHGCLLGLACGDAVGTTVEFCDRGSFPPVTDMTGGGPFHLPVGAWTDDTSMALCLADSLLACDGFNAQDQMERYCRWRWKGERSSTGRCFDIGIATARALDAFERSNSPLAGSSSPNSAGNGCIMRLAPVPLFFYPDVADAVRWAGESSRTTHGAPECIESCRLLAAMICAALSGASKEDVLFSHDPRDFATPKVRAIAAGEYRSKEESAISSSGYVIHCLEASAWCFWHTTTYRDAVLRAANLGDDADTTGAVCGQLAGAFYGEEGMPADWLAKLVMKDEIRSLADQLACRPKK